MTGLRQFNIITLVVCLQFLVVQSILGQQAAITVLDGANGAPVPYAHVSFESLKDHSRTNALTDNSGRVPNNTMNNSIVGISFIGYETLSDTIKPGESRTFRLNPDIHHLDEVVVTAQYAPQRVDKSIYKVEVINGKQIEQKASVNLTDLLNTQMNIRVSQDGALGSSMSIQGLSGEHVKFLVDGVPVIGRMNGDIDISQLNLYNVDHIEIIEGPMSVVYGSNALAGVINIITKENMTNPLTANASIYTESVGIFNINGGLAYNHKNNAISLSGGRNFFGGFSQNDSLRSEQWKPKRQYFLDGYYMFSHPDLKIKFSSSYFNEKLLSKGNLLPPYFETAFDSYFYTIRSTTKLEATKEWTNHRFMNLIAAYSYYNRRKETYFKDLTTLNEVSTTNVEDHDTTIFNSVMARGTYSKSKESSKFNYQLGFDINLENGLGKRITDGRQEIGDYAAFLSIQYAPWKTFQVQPGLRYIYNTKYTAPLVYSLNLKWDFLPGFSARASYSRGFRAPSLKELYLYFVDVNHNIQGNENLEAENSHNFNSNFQFNKESGHHFLEADLDLFYNDINHVITLAQESGTLYTYINVDSYITQGAQFRVNYKLYPHFGVQAGAGLTGRYNSISNEMAGANKFYYSPEAVTVLNYYIVKYYIDFTLNYKYTGRLPQFFIGENDQVTEGFIDSYNMMDFTVGKAFLKNSLNVALGVKNIFNVTTIPAMGGSGGVHTGGEDSTPVGWGRTFFITATYNFKKF